MKQSRYAVVHASVIDSDISDAAFRLYARLASYADREGICWPGVTTLAELAGVQPRQIRRLLTELREAGLVERVPRFREDGSQTSSVTYLPAMQDQAGVSSDDTGTWAMRTVLEQPIEQPSRTPQGRDTARAARGREDTDHMPDPRLEGKEPDFDDKPKPTSTRKKETSHRTCVTFFANQARSRHRIDHFNRGLLNKTITTLRDLGLSYEEIPDYIDHWFSRKDVDIRQHRSAANRTPLDLAVWFRQSVNDGTIEIWRRERASLQANLPSNTAFGASSLNEKLGLE